MGEGLNPKRVFAFSVVFVILHFLITGEPCPGPHSPGSGCLAGHLARHGVSPAQRGLGPSRMQWLIPPVSPVMGFQFHCRKSASPVTAQAPALHEGSLLHYVPPLPLLCLLFFSQGWSRRAGGRRGRGEGKGFAGVWGSGWERAGGHSPGWGQAGGPLGHCGVLFHPRARGCPPGPPKLPPWLQPAPKGFAAPPGSVAPARRNLK